MPLVPWTQPCFQIVPFSLCMCQSLGTVSNCSCSECCYTLQTKCVAICHGILWVQSLSGGSAVRFWCMRIMKRTIWKWVQNETVTPGQTSCSLVPRPGHKTWAWHNALCHRTRCGSHIEGTSVVVPMLVMRYPASRPVKPISHTLLLYFAVTMYRHLFLGRYLYTLNIHDSNKTEKVRCQYIATVQYKENWSLIGLMPWFHRRVV